MVADTNYVRFDPVWTANKAYDGRWIVTHQDSAYVDRDVPARATFKATDWTALTAEHFAALVKDPSNAGLYVVPANSGLTDDPSNSGLYLVGGGTGRIGATTCNGNGNIYRNNENTHPVNESHHIIAAVLAGRLGKALGLGA